MLIILYNKTIFLFILLSHENFLTALRKSFKLGSLINVVNKIQLNKCPVLQTFKGDQSLKYVFRADEFVIVDLLAIIISVRCPDFN